MADAEAVQILSVVTVVLLILSMNYLYKARFKKNIEANDNKVNITGLLIFTISMLLAVLWMWKT